MVDAVVLAVVAVLLLLTLRGSVKQFQHHELQRTGRKVLDGPVVSVRRLVISGMTGPDSEERVKRAIDSVDGCAGEADCQNGTAVVYLDRMNVNDVDLCHAIEAAGYKVDSIN